MSEVALSANYERQLQDACIRYADAPLKWVKWAFDWGMDELKESDGPDTWQSDVMLEIE